MNKKVTDHAIVREELYGTTPEPTYGGALSFMRRKYTTDMSGVDVAVTGIPLDTATTNRPGARFGPRAIRAASSIMAWEKPYGMEFDPFDKLAVVDAGDCFFDHGRPENTPDEIEAHAFGIIDQGPALLSLGGDHFVSYPLLRAHQRKHGGALSLLHFDAHSDTWADDNDRIDHGTMFWWAAKNGLVDPAKSVQIGIRTTNPDTLGFNIIDAPDVHASGVEAVVARTREILGDRPVYLTFDIDCLDPSHAPGTGTPVCGGLTTHQAMAILRGLAGINVVGMDVVEVAPAYDVGEITALAGAHLAMEMLYLYARRPDS
ncbi:MAG: agmatinase [Gammaproteobacteria bacterium]|nr:agmatinase [Gammaproteobacteria bacterium]MDH3756735.1 agmatinase [Gammaproteobacteria bacterium]MDH3862482.1 agmatinase [Gammaproteobacteria bacterium]MDH3905574.1 agmatinase [Gammaproteobacteria bacterium]